MQDPDLERALITKRSGKRPYGAKLIFQIAYSALIGDLENVSILLPSGAVAQIEPARSASWEGGRKFQVVIDGFPTAAEAEAAGQRFAQSMLLLATSLNFGLRLVYHGRLPAAVYERYRSGGSSMYMEARAAWPGTLVLDELIAAFEVEPLDPTLTLSMELYCSALLETNERARFVTVVSALEPLAKQESLGLGVGSFVDSTLATLAAAPNIESDLLPSLRGRLAQLRNESVRQALSRLAKTWFPGQVKLRKQIDYAYSLRSQLLHDGVLSDLDSDLAAETNKTAAILRAIYAQATHRSFRVPADI